MTWDDLHPICTEGAEPTLGALDAHIRRRLRAIQLKHWKRKKTIATKLIALGINRKTAWLRVYEGRKSRWALSQTSIVERALRNSYWDARGLVSVLGRWRAMHEQVDAPAQLRPAGLGYGEVVTRPAAGVITGGPEEPYVKGTCTVL